LKFYAWYEASSVMEEEQVLGVTAKFGVPGDLASRSSTLCGVV
jgi:hypothetical protein